MLDTSVIITTRGDLLRLEWCLEALTIQTYPHFEIIVVNDAFNNEAEDLIAKYKQCFQIAYHLLMPRQHDSRRLTKARNLGAKNSAGDMLLFVDSSVALDSDAIFEHRRRLAADQTLYARNRIIPTERVFKLRKPIRLDVLWLNSDENGENTDYQFSIHAETYCNIGLVNKKIIEPARWLGTWLQEELEDDFVEELPIRRRKTLLGDYKVEKRAAALTEPLLYPYTLNGSLTWMPNPIPPTR